MKYYGEFSYRGYIMHTGAMFGTIMAFNVWFRIWPAQKVIIPAIKNGEAPPADKAALAGMRSKHNTYLSLPLIWSMINVHTVPFSGGNFGLDTNTAWIGMLIFTLIGWGIINLCYRKGAKVPGM